AIAAVLCAALISFANPASAGTPGNNDNSHGSETQTPIKHVIVLIGENRTFDHLFATYVSPSGDSVRNLLSEGIINADGTPGPRYFKSRQFQAMKPFPAQYFIGLNDFEKAPYKTLPVPTLNDTPTKPIVPPIIPTPLLELVEPSLEPSDFGLLFTGTASEFTQTFYVPDPDTRIQDYNDLPNGSFPLKGALLPYDSYTGDTTHRLFEMWQQSDCSIRNATRHNPSGCLSDLYPFVITNYVNILDTQFDNPPEFDDAGGSNSMAFYNMQDGDAPLLKSLADEYSMSDNYHQAVMGGTGANHIMLGTGDAYFWSDGNGNPTVPPAGVIANPNPIPGTDDVYTVDVGYNGDFTECADPTQPGIKPIRDYLASLQYHPNPNCRPNHYYLVNNENPGFLPDGTVDTAGIAKGASIPPSNVRTIGDELNEKGITWAYYGGAYDAAVALEQNPTSPYPQVQIGAAYCNICNFESYANSIMGNPTQRAAHIKDATDFYAAIDNNTLPSVSFVKPDGLLDGHPATSKVDLFEGMLKNILAHLTAQPELFASTALFITMDEGGGYYDSGYIQPLDFFGDGPRIPLIVVSPYATGGHVSHTYADHVSILKFIERNWNLKPLTNRSRDNFPNPIADREDPYVPLNSPAISDLFDLFDFGRPY
ncbi:MAG: alkaline phosphatase family protein, partial [Candidatus Acidiferrales bacterium]